MQGIFITGATGYIGKRLIWTLVKEGNYPIRALVREASVHKLPPGCEAVIGDALDSATYAHRLKPDDIFVHLVGVAHPSPAKKNQFRSIDLGSVKEAIKAARDAGIQHFVYVSVSQYPSSIMREYQLVRAEAELLLARSGMRCSFVRPWYVLGPGHWWPVLLLPFYYLLSLIPSCQEKMRQQGLVTLHQMIQTLLFAIKNPPLGQVACYNVPDIKHIETMTVDLSPVM
jgi:uncharacterized protein YbjT (DUF2867 family)